MIEPGNTSKTLTLAEYALAKPIFEAARLAGLIFVTAYGTGGRRIGNDTVLAAPPEMFSVVFRIPGASSGMNVVYHSGQYDISTWHEQWYTLKLSDPALREQLIAVMKRYASDLIKRQMKCGRIDLCDTCTSPCAWRVDIFKDLSDTAKRVIAVIC